MIKAVSKGHNPYNLLQLSMFDGPLMLCVNLSVVDSIYPESNNCVTGLKIKATGESKLNNSPADGRQSLQFIIL